MGTEQLTDEDASALAQKVATFTEGLEPSEREVFGSILKLASDRGEEDDVQGYVNPIVVRIAAKVAIMGLDYAADKGAFDAIDFKAIEKKLKQQQQQSTPPA